jgi:Kdo2-lipid IVA lauroyltransferase/acyltransferase
MLTRIGLAILWLIHLLPARARAALGTGIGLMMMRLGRERRQVVDTNLRLCFPELSEPARQQLRRRHFMALGRALADTTVAWWSGADRIRKLAPVEGWEHLDGVGDRPVIVLAPHFVGVDILGIRLSIERNAITIYGHQKDPVFDRFLASRRTRFRPTRLVSRQDGIKPVIRGLRERLPLFFLPDMDFGPRDALFVPFFGVPAATVTALPRLAALTGAAVVPATITQLPYQEGYRVRLHPAWENYPGGDLAADTRRMNAFVESCAREIPEQYYWVHKRFKSRPPGEDRLY